jgi:hypothetical protein
MFSLERSLKSAGYGVFPAGTLAADPNPAVPVAITIGGSPAVTAGGACAVAGAASNSDCLVLMYRQNWDFGSFAPASGASFAIPPALTVETISVNAKGQLVSNVNGIISDGIALMKVEYGADADGNGVIAPNEWTQVTPANPLSVMAVRIALVARSAQPEKPSVVGGACDTTVVAPTWVDSANIPLSLTAQADLVAGTEWQCYRYKTFENTVPLRNIVWRP